MFHFITSLEGQKTFGTLTFSGGKEMKHWAKMVFNVLFISLLKRPAINVTSESVIRICQNMGFL